MKCNVRMICFLLTAGLSLQLITSIGSPFEAYDTAEQQQSMQPTPSLTETPTATYDTDLFRAVREKLTADAAATKQMGESAEYPAYYGGRYLEVGSTTLHMLIVRDNPIASYEEIVADYTACFPEANLVLHPATYAFETLQQMQDALTNIMCESHIAYLGIDEPSNRLEICMHVEAPAEAQETVRAFLAEHFPEIGEDAYFFGAPTEIHFTTLQGNVCT